MYRLVQDRRGCLISLERGEAEVLKRPGILTRLEDDGSEDVEWDFGRGSSFREGRAGRGCEGLSGRGNLSKMIQLSAKEHT
jgi:hypothetical protein